jgi:hypothetical protein
MLEDRLINNGRKQNKEEGVEREIRTIWEQDFGKKIMKI